MSPPETRGGARAFVRSLNILLKFARLYEFGHAKTTQQFETTWKELRGALNDSGGSGVLLRASGAQILLGGGPLGATAGGGRRRPLAVSFRRGRNHHFTIPNQPAIGPVIG